MEEEKWEGKVVFKEKDRTLIISNLPQPPVILSLMAQLVKNLGLRQGTLGTLDLCR